MKWMSGGAMRLSPTLPPFQDDAATEYGVCLEGHSATAPAARAACQPEKDDHAAGLPPSARVSGKRKKGRTMRRVR
jgi:hypothetical protein